MKSREVILAHANKVLENYPLENLGLFIIDYKKWNGNDMLFDQTRGRYNTGESGYNAAMRQAFGYMLSTLGTRMTAYEYIKLHELCVNNVKNVNNQLCTLRPCHFDFNKKYVTSEIKDFWEKNKLILNLEEKQNYSPIKEKSYLAVYFDNNLHSRYSPSLGNLCDNSVALEKVIENHFEEYYNSIETAKSDDEKISAICLLCLKLEISHLFSDGNQRTNTFILLTKLLLENLLKPSFVNEPVCFGGFFTLKNLLNMVKDGIENFEKVILQVKEKKLAVVVSIQKLTSEKGYFYYYKDFDKEFDDKLKSKLKIEKELTSKIVKYYDKYNLTLSRYEHVWCLSFASLRLGGFFAIYYYYPNLVNFILSDEYSDLTKTFHYLVMIENPKICKNILDKYPKLLNVVDEFGYTPIMKALFNISAINGNAIIKLLIEAGADLSVKAKDGNTFTTIVNHLDRAEQILDLTENNFFLFEDESLPVMQVNLTQIFPIKSKNISDKIIKISDIFKNLMENKDFNKDSLATYEQLTSKHKKLRFFENSTSKSISSYIPSISSIEVKEEALLPSRWYNYTVESKFLVIGKMAIEYNESENRVNFLKIESESNKKVNYSKIATLPLESYTEAFIPCFSDEFNKHFVIHPVVHLLNLIAEMQFNVNINFDFDVLLTKLIEHTSQYKIDFQKESKSSSNENETKSSSQCIIGKKL